MILRWILRLFGLGFLFGTAAGCGAGAKSWSGSKEIRVGRDLIARRLRRIADRIEQMDIEEEDDVKED